LFEDSQTALPKYDLMKVALARHRFAWLHPFSNGNGRVVRLLTYAMLSGADAG
jgi:Fic family protein